jgi:putative FmdB family regulatory protein
MPVYEYICNDCGKTNEILILKSDSTVKCEGCGSQNLKKRFSSFSVSATKVHTSCCGSTEPCDSPKRCCGSQG